MIQAFIVMYAFFMQESLLCEMRDSIVMYTFLIKGAYRLLD